MGFWVFQYAKSGVRKSYTAIYSEESNYFNYESLSTCSQTETDQ